MHVCWIAALSNTALGSGGFKGGAQGAMAPPPKMPEVASK